MTMGTVCSEVPPDFAYAVLQVKTGGRWKQIKGSKTLLDSHGHNRWHYRVPGTRIQVRARVAEYDGDLVAYSDAVTLT
jgi:hypothetical protein